MAALHTCFRCGSTAVVYDSESLHYVCSDCATVQRGAAQVLLAPHQRAPGRARGATFVKSKGADGTPRSSGAVWMTVERVVNACLDQCARTDTKVSQAELSACGTALTAGVSSLMHGEGPRTASSRAANLVNALLAYGFRGYTDASGHVWERVEVINRVIDQEKLIASPQKTQRLVVSKLLELSKKRPTRHPVLALLELDRHHGSS